MKKKPEVYSHFLCNMKNSLLASARALHNIVQKPTKWSRNKNHFWSPFQSQIGLVLKVATVCGSLSAAGQRVLHKFNKEKYVTTYVYIKVKMFISGWHKEEKALYVIF